MKLHPLGLALFLAGLLASSAKPQAGAGRQVILVPVPKEAAWQDLAFLAAIPASATSASGKPVVIAVGNDGTLRPELRDFLTRYRTERIVWVGSAPQAPTLASIPVEHLTAESADAAACALAERSFARCSKAVVVREDDYACALAAAVLAARWHAPLLFAAGDGPSPAARQVIARMGAVTLLFVGDFGGTPRGAEGASAERLRDPTEVARWMQRHNLPVAYLAAAAPVDRVTGHVRKLSLAAAALAAGRRGAVVPLGTAAAPIAKATDIRPALEQFRSAAGVTPEWLCLAAMPEAIPMAVIPSGEGIDQDPPSDLACGNIDVDPFFELAVGRFVAEDGPAGTLLAARSLAYEDLIDPASSTHFGTAEWERLCGPLFLNVGFAPPSFHPGGKPITQDSPLASCGAIVHNSHSSWMQLGDTYLHDSTVLLAPCLVESAGCSPAALDQDPEHRSVVLRLLRNGAIGFVGNVRRAVAQQELFRSEFWNGILAGMSLGQANRHAQNRALVAVLANGEIEHGLRRYELYNEAVYGDPALVLHLPRAPKVAPASVEVHDRDVIVHAPAEWWRGEEIVPADWKYTESPVIYSWRGAGVGIETSWDGEHHRDRDVAIFTAEVRTRRRVQGLSAVKPPPAPLGWDGRFFVDEHADGSRSVYFRIRLIDFDQATGKILQKADTLRFRLE